MTDQPELLQVFLDWLREASPRVALAALEHVQQARPELWASVEDALRAEREDGVIDMRGHPLTADGVFRHFRMLERNSDRARARALTDPLPYFVHPETRAQMEQDMADAQWAERPAPEGAEVGWRFAAPVAPPVTEARGRLVAGAWEQRVNGDWVRPSPDVASTNVARVWEGDAYWRDPPWRYWTAAGEQGHGPSPEAARQADDDALRAAGWELTP